MTESVSAWRALGTVPPATLAGTRAGLHASLLTAACAHPQRGESDPPVLRGGFELKPADEGALLLAVGSELRPGLRLRDAHLVLFDEEEGEIDAVFDLERQTWPQARIWLEAQCAASDFDFSASRFELPESVFEVLSEKDLVESFTFQDLAPAEELEAWMVNAFGLIASLNDSAPRLDAGLFQVATDLPGGGALGLSLGEPAHPEPFFFAQPPGESGSGASSTAPSQIPSPGFKSSWAADLAAGGAYLLGAEELCGAPAAGCQEKHARAFFEAAFRIFENV